MSSKQHMTPSEAFVETLVAQGVKDVFGIVGSAFMDALDLFPAAGIRFVPTVHEQGAAHMADGYSRVTGRHGVCIAQNGPGITNFVTGVAAAYWAHSPVVAITPNLNTGRKPSAVWGVHCVVAEDARDQDDMVDRAGRIAFRDGFAKSGQRVIIVAGVPLGTPGATNMVRIAYVGPTDTDV